MRAHMRWARHAKRHGDKALAWCHATLAGFIAHHIGDIRTSNAADKLADTVCPAHFTAHATWDACEEQWDALGGDEIQAACGLSTSAS